MSRDELKERRELPKRLAAHVDELVSICVGYEQEVDEQGARIEELLTALKRADSHIMECYKHDIYFAAAETLNGQLMAAHQAIETALKEKPDDANEPSAA